MVREKETHRGGCTNPEIGRLLGPYIAGVCSEEESILFAEHLLVCRKCRDEEGGAREGWQDLLAVSSSSLPRRWSPLLVPVAAAVLGLAVGVFIGGGRGERVPPPPIRFREGTAGQMKADLARIDEALGRARTRELLATRGFYLLRLGRPDEAVAAFEASLCAPPGAGGHGITPGVRKHLALALILAGRPERAVAIAKRGFGGDRLTELWGKVEVFSKAAYRKFFYVPVDRSEGRRYLELAREAESELLRLPPEILAGRSRSPSLLQVCLRVAVLVEGDPESAVQLGEELVEYGRRWDAHHPETAGNEADGLNSLGVALLYRFDALGNPADLDAARIHLSRSLEMRRKSGNPRGEVWALTNLGILDLRVGDYPAARRHLEAARSLAAQVPGGAADELSALPALGYALMGLGDVSRARELFDEARSRASRKGLLHCEAQAPEGLVQLARRTGDRELPGLVNDLRVLLDTLDRTLPAYARRLRDAVAGPARPAPAPGASMLPWLP